MKTNELTSVDDKLVDTGTIHTAMSIYNLLNIDSRVSASGPTRTRRPAGLLPQGASTSIHLLATFISMHVCILLGLQVLLETSRCVFE